MGVFPIISQNIMKLVTRILEFTVAVGIVFAAAGELHTSGIFRALTAVYLKWKF